MTDAVSDLVVEGRSAAEVFENLTKSIAKAAIQAALMGTGPLGGMFGMAAPQGGGAGGIIGTLFSAFSGGVGGSPTGGVRLFKEGGIVQGPGTGRSDSILARISNGEAIIPAHVVATNRPLVQALVSDRLPKYADGLMPDLGALAAGSMAQAEARMNAAPKPNLGPDHKTGMTTEVNIMGGEKTGASTSMGPRGPRTEITIDKAVAAALMNSNSDTRAVLKKLTGSKMTGG